MRIKNKLTVIIPTSIIPSHPETFVIEYFLSSLYKHLPAVKDCRAIVVCDQVPPNGGKSDKWLGPDREVRLAGYLQNLEKLKSQYPIEIHAMQTWGGLPGVTRTGIDLTETKYVLMWQHDMKALRDIDVVGLLKAMDNHPVIQHVHLTRLVLQNKSKGSSRRAIRDSKKTLETAEGFGIPLVRTSAWAASPVFATKQHYLELVLPYMQKPGGIGQKGMESATNKRYSELIDQIGFKKAQEVYGCFVYGAIGDKRHVSHLDGRESAVKRGRSKREHWFQRLDVDK